MAIFDEPLLPHDRSFSGHKRERGCRDVLFLLLFIFFWAGMGVCAFYGFKKGQPEILAYGLDYEGNVCHKNQDLRDLTDFSIRFWVNPKQISETHKVSSLKDSKSLCLANCPQPVAENNTIAWVCNYPDSKNGNPKDRDMESWKQGYNRGTPYDYFQDLSTEAQSSSKRLKGPCYPVLFKSKDQFWSCQFYDHIDEDAHKIWTDMGGVPFGSDVEALETLAVTIEKAIDRLLGGPIDILNRYINDIKNGWEVFMYSSVLLPFVFGFTYLFFLRCCAGVVTWLTVCAVNMFSVCVTLFFFVKAGWISSDQVNSFLGEDNAIVAADGSMLDPSSESITLLKGFAVAAAACTVLLLLFTWCMIPNIKLAVAVLKVASSAVASVPAIILFPVVPFLMMVLLGSYELIVGVLLYSSGEVELRSRDTEGGSCDWINVVEPYCEDPTDTTSCTCGYESKLNHTLRYMLLYHIFGLLWTAQFIIGFGYMTISGVISQYYWNQGHVWSCTGWPVLAAMWRTTSGQLGSVALGSLLASLLQFVRFIIKYSNRMLKKAGESSRVTQCLCTCAQSCCSCLQWLLDLVSRNAYIVAATDGHSFCSAARHAATLILNNAVRIATVDFIGDAILFLGKLMIALACGASAFSLLEEDKYISGDAKVSSPVVLVVVVMLLSFLIATLFTGVMEISVDTILLSFCLDCEESMGCPRYAPQLLLDATGHGSHDPGDARRRSAIKEDIDDYYPEQNSCCC